MSTQIRTWLDNAVLQSVAESYLHMLPQFGGSRPLRDVLNAGVNNLDLNPQGQGATRLTDVQIDWFDANYTIVTHYANDDASGFSATLFRSKTANAQGQFEYTLSFRSTEYQLAAKGGNYEQDGNGTPAGADASIKDTGLAYAQLASMEEFYSRLQQGQVYANGAWVQDPGALAFADAQIAGAKLNVTGYSLGAHLSTAFTLQHWDDINRNYTYNAAGVGVSGAHTAAGATINNLIDLYNNMLAWDGQGMPSWIPDWVYTLNPDSGGIAYFPVWQAFAQAAQAEPGPIVGTSVYTHDKYIKAIDVLKQAPGTAGGLTLGLADLAVDVAQWTTSFGNGPLGRDNNAFISNLHIENDWNQKITQLYGHGEFFDPQFVANSLYHAAPTARNSWRHAA